MTSFYKVVRKTENGYKSVFIGSKFGSFLRASKYELTYIPNEWTLPHPETGGIYVFNNLSEAESFIEELTVSGNIEIWKCEVENPTPFHRIASVSDDLILNFWNAYNKAGRFIYESHPSPFGSCLVSKCMITERIDCE